MSATLTGNNFSPLTPQTASPEVQSILEDIEKHYGRVPNLLGNMANVPVVLRAYLGIAEVFGQSSFTAAEREIIMIVTSEVNGCEYCVAAHSTIAKHVVKADAGVIDSVKAGKSTGDAKLDVLVDTTRTLVENRGRITDEQRTAFLNAGYTPVQLGELAVGITVKTLTNTFDHLYPAEIDASFQPEAR